jgi:hypothetical protein
MNQVFAVQSPEPWHKVIRGLDDSIDAILLVSIPAYPTEVWNSQPQVLLERNLPLVFWSMLEYEEQEFWCCAACVMQQLMIAQARLAESTRRSHLPHCEASGLLEFRDLRGFEEAVSRDHVVVLYGDHLREFEILAKMLGLEAIIF